MKKLLYVLFLLLIICPFRVFAIELDINSNNAVLYNMNEDSILYEKDKSETVSIASLTKIMTAIICFENIDNLDDKVTITKEDFVGIYENNLARAGFIVGEEVTYRDLLYGLLLPSGAEAANSLVRNVTVSEDKFINLMNDKARELGLSNTHFVNVTGLDADGHYSTANDVAIIFKYALKNDEFRKMISKRNYTISNGRITLKSTIKKSLDKTGLSMNYLIGGKTGTTGDAGLCLATIANYNGVEYLLVTVGAPFSFTTPYNLYDAKTIYEYFMNNYSYKDVVNIGDNLVTLDTKYLSTDKIIFKADEEVKMYLDNTFNKDELIYKYKGIDTVTSSNKRKEKLGVVDIYYKDEILTSVDVILDKEYKLDIIKYLKANWIVVIGPICLITLVIGLILKGKAIKKK